MLLRFFYAAVISCIAECRHCYSYGYVWNPSNFSVNYANSAGSANAVVWGNVSSKPGNIVKVSSWDSSTLNLTTCTLKAVA